MKSCPDCESESDFRVEKWFRSNTATLRGAGTKIQQPSETTQSREEPAPAAPAVNQHINTDKFVRFRW